MNIKTPWKPAILKQKTYLRIYLILLPPQENNSYGLEITYNQILFIDSTVEDYQTLIDNLAQPAEVVVLDPQRDGIVQITESLKQHNDLDGIHIISHGDIGELSLGNSKLNQNTLSNYGDELTSWADSLANHGDILLYGCNVAADVAGAEFVKDLSQYTTADILASNNLTGSIELGGDWDLEYAVGDIEAELAFNIQVNQNYTQVLNDRPEGHQYPETK